MRNQTSFFSFAFALIFAMSMSLNNCGTIGGNPGGKNDDDDDGDDGDTTATVSFSLTDAAIEDVESVFITVESLEVLSAEESWIAIALKETAEIDLLALQNGKTLELASSTSLPVGTYKETRLKLSEEKAPRLIDADGKEFALKVPSGSTSGLKIKSSFEVKVDQSLDLTLDFDLRKSIHKAGKKYVLKPVLRLIKDKEAGVIEGQNATGQTVCVYADGVTKDESDDCENAENSGKVSGGKFKVHFIPEGTYSIRVFNDAGTYVDKEGIVVKGDETSDVGEL